MDPQQISQSWPHVSLLPFYSIRYSLIDMPFLRIWVLISLSITLISNLI